MKFFLIFIFILSSCVDNKADIKNCDSHVNNLIDGNSTLEIIVIPVSKKLNDFIIFDNICKNRIKNIIISKETMKDILTDNFFSGKIFRTGDKIYSLRVLIFKVKDVNGDEFLFVESIIEPSKLEQSNSWINDRDLI